MPRTKTRRRVGTRRPRSIMQWGMPRVMLDLPSDASAEAAMIIASAWRPVSKGALQGSVDLELQPSELILHDCTLMESSAKRWVGLPTKTRTGKDGTPVGDAKDQRRRRGEV